MPHLTPTERRTLSLALALLGLATGVRMALDPGRGEFAWRPSSSDRPATSLGAVRRSVDDTLARAAEADRPLASGETIDLNRADAVQLQRLPGVGPARASAIVREREERGPFRAAADLTRVPGIGPSLVKRWAGAVHVAPAAGTEGAAVRVFEAPARVDLNRAQPKELEQITGIGPALARRIVGRRERVGRFSKLEDLLEVPGIGPKTLEIVRKQAYVR